MSKKIDASPISVERTRKTHRLEIVYADDGSLSYVLAHRWLHSVSAGADISTPIYLGVVRIESESIGNAIKNQIANIEPLVDAADAL